LKTEEREIILKLSPKQMLAWDTLMGPDYDELLFGGAKGGAKSWFGCAFSFLKALDVIEVCSLQPSPTPPVIGFMGRKQSVDFTTTTLETWKRAIPYEMYEHKKQEKLLIIQNTATIRYGGLDDSDTVNKMNSAEFAFFFIDQAEEVSEADVGLLRGTLRLKLNGVQPAYKALYTANPRKCWLKPAFITAPDTRSKFIQALPGDNPFIDSKAYKLQLQKAFGFNPQLLQAYLYGSWDELDAAYAVIPASAVESCVDSGFQGGKAEKRITVLDLAEDGTDETVIYDFINRQVRKDTIEIYTHRDLMDTVGRAMAHATKNKSNLICVDKVGLGAGVYSRLKEVYSDQDAKEKEVMTVYGFDGRIEPPGQLNEQTFANYKAWAWFKARDEFMAGAVDIPDDATLRAQLSGVTWHFTNGDVIIIDKNEDLKKNLGASPDRATTVIMGLDALAKAPAKKVRDVYAEGNKPKTKFRPMAV
jgi:phage terminase large subunit